ncbi:hypothetical protein Tco_0680490 [Tanacetum coccineum]|uniref:Reverse transcriptase domain-containing protein n=1 Tax=Tanacetum coccineum TaxID=301880 RepID=A0ABQ4XM38_9ASTR
MGAKNLRGVKQEEAKVEDCDEVDIYDIWDITVEDVERLRLLLTPVVHNLPEPNPVVQPYVPLIPFPDEVNVLLEEFGDDILNITLANEKADFNPTRDIEKLERLIATGHESLSQSAKSSTKAGKKWREMTSPLSKGMEVRDHLYLWLCGIFFAEL